MVGHVERGVIHTDALRRHALFVPHLRDLLRGALLNGDLRAGRERHIDRGARRADIKRDAVMLRQYRHGGGANLVRGVAVPRHAVAAERRLDDVGDMRGKILLLSRDQYAGKPITGGFFQSWCGWLDWNAQSSCSIIGESAASDYKSPLWVQDYANTKDSEGGVAKKVSAVTEMLDHSTKHVTKDESDVVWVFNFASAYPGSISMANGYRENATYTNAAIIEYLQTHEAGPTGVILMDYCVDRSPNEVDGKYLTRGRELVDTLIANNYKWLERRNKTVYDKALERIDKLYEQLQEAQESIATECADVAAEFEDELAAAKEVIDQQKYEIDSLYAGWLFTESYTVDYTGTYRIIRQHNARGLQFLQIL